MTRVALVTGASSGIGLLTSVELASRGFRVFATMRDPRRSDALEDAAAQAGVTLTVLPLDVTKNNTIDACLQTIEDETGRLDVLVNNAGYAAAGFIAELTEAEMRQQFDTNFFGLVMVTKRALPQLVRSGGQVINVSSGAGRLAKPGMGIYCASKFAVEGISEAMRLEFAKDGVAVHMVEPGPFRTKIFEDDGQPLQVARAGGDVKTAQRLEGVMKRITARAKTAEPVASLIADIASKRPARLRHPVGKEAWISDMAARVLPFPLWERLIGRVLKQ